MPFTNSALKKDREAKSGRGFTARNYELQEVAFGCLAVVTKLSELSSLLLACFSSNCLISFTCRIGSL